MTFTLDHPHGYKLAGFPESEARIVARDGRNDGYPLIVEFRMRPGDAWILTTYPVDGITPNMPKFNLINAPAPKRKVYVAMVLDDTHGPVPCSANTEAEAQKWPARISPVVPVEIDV